MSSIGRSVQDKLPSRSIWDRPKRRQNYPNSFQTYHSIVFGAPQVAMGPPTEHQEMQQILQTNVMFVKNVNTFMNNASILNNPDTFMENLKPDKS